MTETVAVALITGLVTLAASISGVMIAQFYESRRADRADRRERLASVREPLAAVVTNGLLWAETSFRVTVHWHVSEEDSDWGPRLVKHREAYTEGIAHLTLLLPTREVGEALDRLESARKALDRDLFLVPKRGEPDRAVGARPAHDSLFRFQAQLADLQAVIARTLHAESSSQKHPAGRSRRADKGDV